MRAATSLPYAAPEPTLEDLLDRVDVLGLDRARSLLSPAAVRQRRLDRRDQVIRLAMTAHYGGAHGQAVSLARDLRNFRAAGFNYSADSDTPKQASLRAILIANSRRVLGARALQLIASGGRTPEPKTK